MTRLRTELDRAWAVLERPKQGFSTLQLTTQGETEVRAAVNPDSQRHLLIKLDAGQNAGTSRGILSIDTVPLRFGGMTTNYLALGCTDPQLNDEFQEVAVDVLEAVRSAREPAIAAIRVVERWRTLLRRTAPRLTEAQKIGLFAELSVLEAILISGREFAPDMWTGPQRQPHDFELSEVCIEVKAVGHSSDAIEVHGIQQLDEHDDRPLFLVIVEVRANPDGRSITELLSTVRRRTGAPRRFDEVLRTGRVDIADPGLDEPGYDAVGCWVAHATKLPRIVVGSLPGDVVDSILRVDYQLRASDVFARATPTDMTELTKRLGL